MNATWMLGILVGNGDQDSNPRPHSPPLSAERDPAWYKKDKSRNATTLFVPSITVAT